MQRSGTNFVETIMKRNFIAHHSNPATRCWKHSIDLPERYEKRVPTLVIYKNPYTWIESICLRNQVDWIKKQTKYPANEVCNKNLRLGPKNFNVINVAKTYKHFHETWFINNPCDNRIAVRYEDMLQENTRNEILNKIQTQFLIERHNSNKGWIIPERGVVSQSRDYNGDREKYYLEMKPKNLSDMQIDAINKNIGTDLIEKMGYNVL